MTRRRAGLVYPTVTPTRWMAAVVAGAAEGLGVFCRMRWQSPWAWTQAIVGMPALAGVAARLAPASARRPR